MLSERHRATLYQGLAAVIEDEEAVAQMLAHFPTHPDQDPVTEARLAIAESTLERRMDALDTKIDALDTKINHRIDALDTKINRRIDALELRFDAVDLRVDAAAAHLESEVHKGLRHLPTVLMGSQAAFLAVVVAVIALLR